MVKRQIATFIILLFLTTLGAQGVQQTASAKNYLSDIRQVDFKDFTYSRRGDDAEAKTLHLRGGSYESASGAQTSLMRVAYGDLTGDGVEEAVIILRGQNTRNSRTLDELFIYTLENGKVVLLANFEGGKRGDYICSVPSSENNFKVEKQQLIIDLAVALEGDPLCDPTRYYTIKFRWDGHQIIEVERSTLKPLPEDRREVG